MLRGTEHQVDVPLRLGRQQDEPNVRVTGTWEGRLTDLGIKPFRALMGALRLEDWAKLRIDARMRDATERTSGR